MVGTHFAVIFGSDELVGSEAELGSVVRVHSAPRVVQVVEVLRRHCNNTTPASNIVGWNRQCHLNLKDVFVCVCVLLLRCL